MIHAISVELRKLYSRWATLSPFPLIALVLGLVAWNVALRGAGYGVAPATWGVTVFAPLMWWLPAVFVIVSASGSLGGEFEQGTARTTLLTPISRGRFLLAKFIACQAHALVIVLFTGLTSLLLAWALYGEVRLPLFAGNEIGLTILAPWQSYPGELLGWQAVSRLVWIYAWLAAELCALVALTFMVATIARHGVAALSVTAAIVVLMWILSTVEALAQMRPLLLVSQARGWIWVGSAIVPWDDIVRGLICMGAYTLVSLIVAWIVLERRDVDV